MTISLSLTVLFHILAAFLIHDVDSASPDFCLAHLNMSDCGFQPTPVFHYYRPGSICKQALWKGCPTENVFQSAQECKNHCIKNTRTPDKVPEVRKVKEYRCDIPLDTRACSLQSSRVFTYNNEKQSCIEAEWYGCPSQNKFRDIETCEDTCYDTEIGWKNKLKNLDIHAIKTVQNVVDELLKTNEIEDESEEYTPGELLNGELNHSLKRNLTFAHLKKRPTKMDPEIDELSKETLEKETVASEKTAEELMASTENKNETATEVTPMEVMANNENKNETASEVTPMEVMANKENKNETASEVAPTEVIANNENKNETASKSNAKGGDA